MGLPEPASVHFPPTRWTQVRRATADGDKAAADEALACLCERYWYPLYAFARRLGRSAHEAEDLTQSFFAYLLEQRLFAMADPAAGRLRTFLLTVFTRFISRARDRDFAKKRGGGAVLSLDAMAGEERYSREPVDQHTPESLYARSWALTVVQSALSRLAATEAEAGRAAQFQELQEYIDFDGAEGSYGETAVRMGLEKGAVRQAVSRLRRNLREALRQQIADTLQEPSEANLEEELASLRAALCD